MPVPAYGNPNAKIMLIGEAPSTIELREGEPFKGPSGGLLDDCLHTAVIARAECYITNVFDDMVRKDKKKTSFYIGEDLVYKHNGGFTYKAKPYLERLNQEINASGANVIVPLGGCALTAVMGDNAIGKFRGSILESPFGKRKVIPTIHPAAAFQNYLDRYKIIFDLKRVKKQSAFPEIIRKERNYIFEPEVEEIEAFISTWRKIGDPLTLDIEVYNQEISCLGIGNAEKVMVIPFTSDRGNYWKIQNEAAIWSWISDIMEDEAIPKIGQNLLFDTWVLGRNNKIITQGEFHDTMVSHNLLYPDFKKGLDFICSVHTEEPFYKDDGKQWFKSPGSMKTLWLYNARDVAVTDEAHYVIQDMMDDVYKEAYRRRMAMFPALLYMQLRGVKADRKALNDVREDIANELKNALQQFDDVVLEERIKRNPETAEFLDPVSPTSPTQLANYFYTEQKRTPYTNRKTGNVSTDDIALKRLIKGTKVLKPLKEASIVQEIRGLAKLKSTYLDIEFDTDNRLRCSYNPCGTNTGRLSSSQTLFGTGANMQNLPQQFKRFLVADEGCLFAGIDKRQAEWVVVAYLAQDARMIEVVESGKDTHLATAYFSFGVSEELILKEAELIGHSTDPEFIAEQRAKIPELQALIDAGLRLPSSMSMRQAGKKSNHGLNYGMQYKTFALNNEIPENDSKIICDRYHDGYPGIEHTYHEYVKSCLNTNRTLINLFGRPRRFLDRWGYSLLLAAFAYIPQSTIGELVGDAMSEMVKYIDLLSNEHDATLVQHPVTTEEEVNQFATLLYQARTHMSPTLTFQQRSFTVGTDIEIGQNWGEASDKNPNGMNEISFCNSQDELAQLIWIEAKKL